MNKLMDWMKGKFMKYHISDKEYDMIQADMQEENRNSLLFFSVITILFLFVMLLISFYSPVFVRFRSAYILLMLVAVLILAGTYKNISSLIAEAEKRMYEDKRLYYQNSGIDRRARI